MNNLRTYLIFWVLACNAFIGLAHAQTFYVATNGSDQPFNGSQQTPWASISYAIDQVTGGATIDVAPGTYNGRVRLDQSFTERVLIRSTIAYKARLRYDNGAVVTCFTCAGIVLEGFDIAHASNNSGALLIQIQNSGVSDVTLRNNVIHDSTNNDLLKINNGARNVVVENNIFYNQAGSDEHIDINSVVDVTVRDNLFFNSEPQSITSSYIVIKDSNGNSDGVLGSKNINVQRNIFFNWQGNTGQSFIRVGEDATANFEADNVLIENNLMIGNSEREMRSSFTVQGSKNVRFRSNTIVGDLPSRSFAARLLAVGDNRPNQNIILSNNLWSDPTGSMGAEGFNGADVFDAPLGDNASVQLNNNLYYNGGNPIPTDTSQEVNLADDASAVIGDPRLPSHNNLIAPIYNGNGFQGGFSSIRDVFVDFANRYAKPASNSSAIDNANPNELPFDDILGANRTGLGDIGAFEVGGIINSPPKPNEKTVLSWLMFLLNED